MCYYFDMKLDPAIKNYRFYFKEARRPIIWLLDIDIELGMEAAKRIYSGATEWFESDSTILDVIAKDDVDAVKKTKPLSADIMLVNGDASPLSFLDFFLDKAKIYVIKTKAPDSVKQKFRELGLVLADEFEYSDGLHQQTWVRLGSRRG